jgi:hypothetical protein
MLVKITKIKELEDALYPNNIEVGFEAVKSVKPEEFELPILGERFWLGWWSTSNVKEIIDDNTFRTYNSIYKWEILPELNSESNE